MYLFVLLQLFAYVVIDFLVYTMGQNLYVHLQSNYLVHVHCTELCVHDTQFMSFNVQWWALLLQK